jgi:hypothetical protein
MIINNLCKGSYHNRIIRIIGFGSVFLIYFLKLAIFPTYKIPLRSYRYKKSLCEVRQANRVCLNVCPQTDPAICLWEMGNVFRNYYTFVAGGGVSKKRAKWGVVVEVF